MNATLPMESTVDDAALRIREALLGAKALAIALVGPPGAGKTSILELTMRCLRGKARTAAIVVNPSADRDAERLLRYCGHVEAIHSPTADPSELWSAIERVDLSHTDYLFIETLGGISGVPDFGQDATVAVMSVSGGDDKAATYANLVKGSQAVILSKIELHSQVTFNRDTFRKDVQRISPNAGLMELSAFVEVGFDNWLNWLDQRRQEKDPAYQPARGPLAHMEWFVG